MLRLVHNVAFVAAILWASVGSASTLTERFSSFYALGDSLTDTGKASYASDGPIWVEGLLAEFAGAGLDAENFAYGGATATNTRDTAPNYDLDAQVDFLLDTLPSERGDAALVSLFIGGNDVRRVLEGDATIEGFGNAIEAALLRLTDANFENFLIFEVPDVGLTPLAQAAGFGGAATGISQAFNGEILEAIGTLASGAKAHLVELFDLNQQLVTDPLAFGLTSYGPCALTGENCETAIYWDSFHPTGAVHAIIEAEARAALAPVPLPASALLLLVALGAFGIARRV